MDIRKTLVTHVIYSSNTYSTGLVHPANSFHEFLHIAIFDGHGGLLPFKNLDLRWNKRSCVIAVDLTSFKPQDLRNEKQI